MHATAKALRTGMPPRRHDGRRDHAFWEGQIALYKLPHYVNFVDGFPMTVTAEVQKFLMRQQMIDELGLSLQATA
jgi:hypothetical protein